MVAVKTRMLAATGGSEQLLSFPKALENHHYLTFLATHCKTPFSETVVLLPDSEPSGANSPITSVFVENNQQQFFNFAAI